MTLHPAGDGAFDGHLSEHWTIGPKIHGGVMVALCAKAATLGYRRDGDTADPVAVSVNFLSAPDPGPVRLRTAVRKRGRRIGLLDVELMQGDRACVHAVVTLGEAEHDSEPLMSVHPAVRSMTPVPPGDVPAIGPGHPGAAINNLARGCLIHPQIAETLAPGEAPEFRIWVRPRTDHVDEFFALMCGDISLPVSYAVGRRGWAPTVQLTAYLRGRPADGWLRVVCTATQIGQDWFDADHTVLDSSGRIVVQTRQLALVPGL
ncbi:MAG: thioesterase family protein [Mycobacteriaceae bacterium]